MLHCIAVRSSDDFSSSTSPTTTTTTTSVVDATNGDNAHDSMATSDVAFTFNNDPMLTTLDDDSTSAVTDGGQTIPMEQEDSTFAYPEASTLVGESDPPISRFTAEDQGFSVEDEGTDGGQTIPVEQEDSTIAYPGASTLVGESDSRTEDQGFTLEDEGTTVDSPVVTDAAQGVSVQNENNQVLTTEWGEEVTVWLYPLLNDS